jgi:predicted DNA-binding transcriptional regulator AlpA
MDTQPPLLRSAASVSEIIGIRKRTFHNRRRRDDFPKPVVLGMSTVRWHRHEIEAWIPGLPAETRIREEPR